MSFVPATTSCTLQQQPSSQQPSSQHVQSQDAHKSPEYYEKGECPCEECISTEQTSLVNRKQKALNTCVKDKQQQQEELEESSTKVNSPNTITSPLLEDEFFSKFPPPVLFPTESTTQSNDDNNINNTPPSSSTIVDTVSSSLHDHKTCQCSACLYKLAFESMLQAKELEINYLKNIIHNNERIQNEHSRVIESKNQHIVQLEKTVKDKSDQLQLAEHSNREQIHQLNSEIDSLRSDNQTKVNELKHLTDENTNLKQSLANEGVKLKQSNDNCELLKRTNLAAQHQFTRLQQSFDSLTEIKNNNSNMKLQEELDQQFAYYYKEMKQIKQSVQQQQQPNQLNHFVARAINENEKLKMDLKASQDSNQISENELNQFKVEYDQLNGLLARTKKTTDGLIVQYQQQIDKLNCEMKQMFEEFQQHMDAIKKNLVDERKSDELAIESKKIETILQFGGPSTKQSILVNNAQQSIDHFVNVVPIGDDGRNDVKSDDGEKMKEQSKDEDAPSTSENIRRSSLRKPSSISSISSSISTISAISAISTSTSSTSPLKRKSTTTNCSNDQTPPKRIRNMYDFNDCSKQVIHLKHLNCYSEVCEAKFNSVANLNQHYISIHKLLPFRCFAADCEARYENSKQLREHIYSHHSIHTRFTCPAVGCAVELDEQFSDYKHWNHFHLRGEFECSRCDFVGSYCKVVFDHQKRTHSQLLSNSASA